MKEKQLVTSVSLPEVEAGLWKTPATHHLHLCHSPDSITQTHRLSRLGSRSKTPTA